MENYSKIKGLLISCGISLEKGLTEAEIGHIENLYKFSMPSLLRDFYREMLPVSQGFINWRDDSVSNIEFVKSAIQSPIDDIISIIKDESDDDKIICDLREEMKKDAISFVKNIPVMIPIFSHRYMPAIQGPCHPVFSIVGDDIIIYGTDIKEYFYNEFGENKAKEGYILTKDIMEIPFWSRFL